MLAVTVLVGWIALGAISAVGSARDSRGRDWIPMALFFGPMWILIALEQERAQ